MLQNRRADASMFAAMLLVVMLLLGSAGCGLALIALSSPLIARVLMKKEFLFHRRVRWVAGATIVLTLVLAYVLRREAWRATGMAMLSVALVSWWIYRSPKLPRFMVGEAVCVGAFLAESLGTLLHLFPS
jgi:cell division protein FtsW (lipid II flippase)